jgi:hypothetical protein
MLALASVAVASAAPLCIAGASLASYQALGAGGCMVDLTSGIIVNDFSYTVLASSNPGVVTPNTAISVTPVFPAPGRFGIDFTSTSFTLSGTDFVKYRIGFTWDPDVRSADDLLETSTPVAPGFAKVTTTLCELFAFSGTSCSGTTATLNVSHDGITPLLTDSITFAPDNNGLLGVLNELELNGGNTGSSEIRGFANNITLVPEPSAFAAVAIGILTLALWGRLPTCGGLLTRLPKSPRSHNHQRLPDRQSPSA